MTCAEYIELAGAHALHALEPEERRLAEEHLRESHHEGCPEALARALATVVSLAAAHPSVAPSEGVWRSIAIRAGIEGGAVPESAEPASVATAARTARPRRVFAPWQRYAVPLAAAAALLAAGLWARERSARGRAESELASAQASARSEGAARAALLAEVRALRVDGARQRDLAALLELPGSRVVALAPVPGRTARASAVVNVAQRRAVVLSSALQPQPAKDYQLWVIRGKDAPRPAGFLRFEGAALAVGDVDPELLAVAPDALAISLEPAGGRPSPTEVVALGKLGG